MRLDLEELAGRESREFDGFNERLLTALPGLSEHQCSRGYAGGFVERLREGTYFGHVVEHVALELTRLAGVGANHGRTRVEVEPNVYNVVLDYGHNSEAFASVCRTAARWRKARVTGVVGVPGDRSDELIERAARIAARGFGRIVIKEDKDLRGRRPGEVAEMMRRVVKDEAPSLECTIAPCEEVALRRILAEFRAEKEC
ncbi:MAG TPA: cyanophycin synthetase [Pyrinomonadaceae bacterium]